jgi:hypothetical protein
VRTASQARRPRAAAPVPPGTVRPPGYPLRRHNDAAHPLYALSTLADFGLQVQDPGVAGLVNAVTAHFDGEGFQTLMWFPRFRTKETDTEGWGWSLCDAPTLLYLLLAFVVLQRQIDRSRVTGPGRAFLAVPLHRLPRVRL